MGVGGPYNLIIFIHIVSCPDPVGSGHETIIHMTNYSN